MYELLKKQITSVFEGQDNVISNSANFSALLFNNLKDLNWVGFYFKHGNELILGPFQGNTACVEIKIGNGVCGTAFENNETIVVSNVHDFPGHIACDPNSKSEIVVPLKKNGILYGVLDIDSPIFNRFSDEDKNGIESLLNEFVELTNVSALSDIYSL